MITTIGFILTISTYHSNSGHTTIPHTYETRALCEKAGKESYIYEYYNEKDKVSVDRSHSFTCTPLFTVSGRGVDEKSSDHEE